MTHSLLSSAITNTDWYMESLEEHIVDILHSGFSLQTQITLCVNKNYKHMVELCIRAYTYTVRMWFVAKQLSNIYKFWLLLQGLFCK